MGVEPTGDIVDAAPPVLKITIDVLTPFENPILYLIPQKVTRWSY